MFGINAKKIANIYIPTLLMRIIYIQIVVNISKKGRVLAKDGTNIR